jgi:hypothetical protein
MGFRPLAAQHATGRRGPHDWADAPAHSRRLLHENHGGGTSRRLSALSCVPNATVRANAQALPEAIKPEATPRYEFTAASIDVEEVDETSARIEASSLAYAGWLAALARVENPEEEDAQTCVKIFREERAALRKLFLAPAACAESLWAKLSAFEISLVREQVAGPLRDSVLLLGLGSIKADLMNLGIKGSDF